MTIANLEAVVRHHPNYKQNILNNTKFVLPSIVCLTFLVATKILSCLCAEPLTKNSFIYAICNSSSIRFTSSNSYFLKCRVALHINQLVDLILLANLRLATRMEKNS